MKAGSGLGVKTPRTSSLWPDEHKLYDWQSGCLTLKETVVELPSGKEERKFYSTSSLFCTCFRSDLCDWLFYSEDGIHIFLRNVGKLLPGCRATHLTRQSPWETPISHGTFAVSQISWFGAITLGLFLPSLCSRHRGLGFQEVTVLECLLTPLLPITHNGVSSASHKLHSLSERTHEHSHVHLSLIITKVNTTLLPTCKLSLPSVLVIIIIVVVTM